MDFGLPMTRRRCELDDSIAATVASMLEDSIGDGLFAQYGDLVVPGVAQDGSPDLLQRLGRAFEPLKIGSAVVDQHARKADRLISALSSPQKILQGSVAGGRDRQASVRDHTQGFCLGVRKIMHMRRKSRLLLQHHRAPSLIDADFCRLFPTRDLRTTHAQRQERNAKWRMPTTATTLARRRPKLQQ
jgi:hypothetical protein